MKKNLFLVIALLLAMAVNCVYAQNPTKGKLGNHEWVDLGLPSGTKWATCNVDATSAEQAGKLYAWGETTTKSAYTEANSLTDGKQMTDIAGDKTYDVATLKWGEGWRTPTKEEMNELLEYCNDKYVQRGGRWGREFTSTINNQTIFLPATGSKEGTKLIDYNGCGVYWTSTPTIGRGDCCANMYNFGAALGEMGSCGRFIGLAIRPVTK